MPAILVPILEREQKTAFFAHFIVIFIFSHILPAAASDDNAEFASYYEEYKNVPSEKLFEIAEQLGLTDNLDRASACYHIISSRYDDRMDSADKQLCTYSLNREGVIAFIRSDYTKAYQLFSRAITLADDSCRNECLNNLAVIYSIFRDYDKAHKYLEESFDLSLKMNAWSNLLTAVHNLIYIDFATEHYDASAERIGVFRQIDMPHNDEYYYTVHICNGAMLLADSHYAESIAELNAALEKTDSMLQSDRLKADLYQYLAQACFLMGSEQQGLDWLDVCEQHARQYDLYDAIRDVYWHRARHYETTGNWSLAKEARYKYMEIKDSLFNASEYGKIKDMLLYNEMEKHERQMIRYDVERKMRTTVIAIIGIALLLTLALLAWTIVLNRRLSKRNKDLYKKNVEYLNATENERIQRNTIKGYRSNLSEERRSELVERIQAVLDDVDIISAADFNLDRLSALTDSNVKYVSQMLNETMGKSFTTLLNEHRINEVCKRLADHEHYGQLSIEAIAESMGFRSRSHFADNFRTVTGLTPLQYRRLARQN